jgi:LmbE family N-acetylglucosaminyl deacetylase
MSGPSSLLPPLPGAAERIHSASALVVAPHFDDEILGCGGLASRLAEEGAEVRVLFLSDGGGGVESVADAAAYRARRRGEAERVAELLGFAGCAFLDLPDGSLDQHLAAIAAGLRRALAAPGGKRPELLLIPSPLEISRDHRAAFAALHSLLHSLRDALRLDEAETEPQSETFDGLRILAYEVNHPAHPDFLVDVSDREELLRAAMALYGSQEERHPYLNAGLGLRRFRTLSLGAEVALAEGYRRLDLSDFTTRSLAQLVRHLGGLPEIHAVREGPLVSVVVRTRNRPQLLAEALASLAEGSYRRVEVVLVNDGGEPPIVPEDFSLPLRSLDLQPNRGRAGAAQAGIEAATGDYVAFLDDDDLAAPEHLATLAGLVATTGVRVAYTDAAVGVYELESSEESAGWVCRERRLPYSRDFDRDVLLVDNYIPFNTLLIERRLLAEAGPLDDSLPFFEDWDLLIRLAALTPFHHLACVTCEYRHFRGGADHIFGERPRERADFLAMKAKVFAKHAARLRPEVLARAVDTLRAEIVERSEAGASARRETERLQGDLQIVHAAHRELAVEKRVAEERYHAAYGETVAQQGEIEALRGALAATQTDVQRLYDDDAKLRGAIGEQTEQLTRTYAEIERLNALIRAMEGTRAWKLHQRWSRSGR